MNSTKQKERKGEGRGEEDKGSTVLVYIGILVTFATTGYGGSVLVHLLHKQNGRSFFFPTSIFYLPFLWFCGNNRKVLLL